MKSEGASNCFATAVQHLPIYVCVHHIMGWVGIIMFVSYTSPAERQIFFSCDSGGLAYEEAGGLCTGAVSCCGGCVVQRL